MDEVRSECVLYGQGFVLCMQGDGFVLNNALTLFSDLVGTESIVLVGVLSGLQIILVQYDLA